MWQPRPLNFSVLGSQWQESLRESLTRFIPVQLKLPGLTDDGKRSSLDVTFARAFPRGITQFTPKSVGLEGLIGVSGAYFCTTTLSELNFGMVFWFDVIVCHLDTILVS